MKNETEEIGMMIDLLQHAQHRRRSTFATKRVCNNKPFVIDEGIDIKEEGFLQNAEDSYNYINEESESEIEQNAARSYSSPKLVSNYFDDCSSNYSGQTETFHQAWKISNSDWNQVRNKIALTKTNNYTFIGERKLQSYDNRLHKNGNFSEEVNTTKYPKLAFEKWVRCDICNKAFAYACLLTQHKLIHLGIKKYHCELCNKAFSQLGNLNVHLLIHRGIKNYHCDICNRAFTQSSNLSQHKLIHSGVKRFKCDICNEAFAQTSTLRRHKLIHMGIKKYKCNVCNKAFRQSGTLHNHKLTHSEVKNFVCEICRKAFSRPHLLKKHKVVHTGDV